MEIIKKEKKRSNNIVKTNKKALFWLLELMQLKLINFIKKKRKINLKII